jgi:hypothetical protein
MATTTALFSIGHSHPNHGGIWGSNDRMELTENSMMCLHLFNTSKQGETTVYRMNPSIDKTIYDAYVLMAYVLFGWREFPEGSIEFDEKDNHLSITTNSETELNELHKSAMGKLENTKVVVSMLHGCTMLSQMNLFRELPYSFEALVPAIVRERSQWGDFNYDLKDDNHFDLG